MTRLDDVPTGLDNLPNEVQHLLDEIRHKETRVQGEYRVYFFVIVDSSFGPVVLSGLSWRCPLNTTVFGPICVCSWNYANFILTPAFCLLPATGVHSFVSVRNPTYRIAARNTERHK